MGSIFVNPVILQSDLLDEGLILKRRENGNVVGEPLMLTVFANRHVSTESVIVKRFEPVELLTILD